MLNERYFRLLVTLIFPQPFGTGKYWTVTLSHFAAKGFDHARVRFLVLCLCPPLCGGGPLGVGHSIA